MIPTLKMRQAALEILQYINGRRPSYSYDNETADSFIVRKMCEVFENDDELQRLSKPKVCDVPKSAVVSATNPLPSGDSLAVPQAREGANEPNAAKAGVKDQVRWPSFNQIGRLGAIREKLNQEHSYGLSASDSNWLLAMLDEAVSRMHAAGERKALWVPFAQICSDGSSRCPECNEPIKFSTACAYCAKCKQTVFMGPLEYRSVKPALPETDSVKQNAKDLTQTWPVGDVLKKLADATEHLLRDHNCDHHGYEEWTHCVGKAREYVASERKEWQKVDDECAQHELVKLKPHESEPDHSGLCTYHNGLWYCHAECTRLQRAIQHAVNLGLATRVADERVKKLHDMLTLFVKIVCREFSCDGDENAEFVKCYGDDVKAARELLNAKS